MTHILGHDRCQLLLLPEAVDDYVGSDNPVRFIDAFVDGLDLAAASFSRVEAKLTGRPGYAPADLLKLYIYGYLNRVRSSRRLEAETHRNIEVIWLLRRLKPDFKTIADFRRDNRTAFRAVFREFVLLCRQLDLFGRELLAVDGTRIKAVNNKDRNFMRASLRQYIDAAEKRLADYLRRLDEGDIAEGGAGGGSRVQEVLVRWAARRTGRAVKSTAQRSESLVVDAHGRDMITTGEMGFDSEGRIVALRATVRSNLGAFLTNAGAVPSLLAASFMSNVYAIPAVHVTIEG